MPVRETFADSSSPAPAESPDAADPVIRVLKRYWGYDTLRPLQAEAIAAGLARRDSLVVMPTGGGKSLCYQIPPAVTGEVCVCVSPLISLMQDQVDGLRVAGYPAGALHSGVTGAEATQVRREARAGRLRLLFMAPERLLAPGTIDFLREIGVRSIAVDEAHCISQWGHDFRPEYRRLAELRGAGAGGPLGDLAVHAYTATATPAVRDDIVAQLHLRDPQILVGTFDRPNLTYRVVPKVRMDDQVAQAVRRHPGRAVIVYCITRKETEDLAAGLRADGLAAQAYHAGLDPALRARISSDFRSERLSVVVATVAFGMGIDRSDVRCVVHAAMPKTIEGYQQETGRAGRDGMPSECVMLYSAADLMRWRRIMERAAGEQGTSPEVLHAQIRLLNQMQSLAASTQCRHRALSEYFGQPYPLANCGACDVCLDELGVAPDATDIARKILSCVARVKESFGAGHVADVLRGSNNMRVLEKDHHTLSVFGLLRSVPRDTLMSYINQLIDQAALARDDGEFPVLKLTPASWEVMRQQRTVTLLQPATPAAADPSVGGGRARGPAGGPRELSPAEQALFERLREVRRELAAELSVPPYVVFGDATLEEFARVRPASLRTFVDVRGVGATKAANFSERFLSAIAAHCAAAGLELDAEPGSRPRRLKDRAPAHFAADDAAPDARSDARADARPPRPPATGPRARSAAMFARGSSIDEVAAELRVTPATAAGHLVDWIAGTSPASVARWVDDATYQDVARAVASTAAASKGMLRPVHDALGASVPYETIRIVVAHLKTTGA